jgi:hypothetical protein
MVDIAQYDEDAVDNCFCDIKLDDAEIVADVALPPSAGGVEATAQEYGNEDSVDGCDVDFKTDDPIADEELPAATGGVIHIKP